MATRLVELKGKQNVIIGTYSGTTYERVEQPKPHKKVEQPVSTKPLCNRCELDPAWAGGRCVACVRYRHRHGVERPYRLIEMARQRRTSPHWCKNCGKPTIYRRLRCKACYEYWKRLKKERPEWRWNNDCTCKTCGFPKSAAPFTKRGQRAFYAGRCLPCYKYFSRHQQERPKELWGCGQLGYCECGYPAEHQIDGFNLCNRCVEEFR